MLTVSDLYRTLQRLLFLTIVLVPAFCFAAGDTTFLFIAGNGNSKNPGTEQKPFGSLESARDAIRSMRKMSRITGPVVVYLRAGTYFLNRSFELTAADAAPAGSPVIYKAYSKEYVELNGGTVIRPQAAAIVTDRNVLNSLPASARGKVYSINMSALGVSDMGTIHSAGFRRPYFPAAMEIFINKLPLHVARYPNDSNLLIKKVISPNGTIGYDDSRPSRWLNAKDAWMGGTFCWGWADDEIPIRKIDTVNKTISTTERSMFNFETGQDFRRWFVFNLLEEIDEPGEYYIDNRTATIYFYPQPGRINSIEVSLLETPMIMFRATSNTSFQNINFENMRGMAVYMEEGQNNKIKNCTFRNIGMVPVVFGMGVKPFKEYIQNGTGEPASAILGSWHEHLFDNPDFDRKAGKNNGIEGCRIYNGGNGGVSLGGGNRRTLDAAGNYVINCDIYSNNRLGKTYKGAVNIDGVGNVIRGNHLHHTSQIAVYMHGNDHLIEYNEVNNACQSAEDMGAFYMGRDPSETGYKIRYNFIHDVIPKKSDYRIAGMYFDDGAYGQNIYGNVFYKVGNGQFGAVFIHGGHDFLIQNNVFVECPTAIGDVNWDEKKWTESINSDLLQSRLFKKINIGKPPYTTEYPDLVVNLSKKQRTSKAINNIALDCGQFCPSNYIMASNYVTNQDPGFADISKRNFNLKSGVVLQARIPGFEKLPFEKMGTSANAAGNPNDKYGKLF